MTVPTPLPEPSQSPNWAAQLNAAITDRYEDAKQAAGDVADTINTGRLSETALEATFVSKADTGATGLAVLAAALPADAREALDITIDTSVGTRVMLGGIMVYYVSGRRRIESMLANGWTAAYLALARNGSTVSLAAAGLDGSAATSDTLTTLPEGFRNNAVNAGVARVPGVFQGDTHLPLRTTYHTGATALTRTAITSATVYAQWLTNDPWPTSLPGIPG